MGCNTVFHFTVDHNFKKHSVQSKPITVTFRHLQWDYMIKDLVEHELRRVHLWDGDGIGLALYCMGCMVRS